MLRHADLTALWGQVVAYAGPCKGTQIILGNNWVPFQPPTTITPSFPSFTSAHSTFSAAAAQVMPRHTTCGVPFSPEELCACVHAHMPCLRNCVHAEQAQTLSACDFPSTPQENALLQ